MVFRYYELPDEKRHFAFENFCMADVPSHLEEVFFDEEGNVVGYK